MRPAAGTRTTPPTPSRQARTADVPKLMAGKRGLSWACQRALDRLGHRQALHHAGAEMAFTYQGAAFGKRVLPMVEARLQDRRGGRCRDEGKPRQPVRPLEV
jgi:enoyl-[acyl-carrier protein] reductase I